MERKYFNILYLFNLQIIVLKKRSKGWISFFIFESDWFIDFAQMLFVDYIVNNVIYLVLFQEVFRYILEGVVVIEIVLYCLL